MGFLRNSECLSFQTFTTVVTIQENLLVEITRVLGTKESHLLS